MTNHINQYILHTTLIRYHYQSNLNFTQKILHITNSTFNILIDKIIYSQSFHRLYMRHLKWTLQLVSEVKLLPNMLINIIIFHNWMLKIKLRLCNVIMCELLLKVPSTLTNIRDPLILQIILSRKLKNWLQLLLRM